MTIAKGTIIVNGKEYKEGQAVKVLSEVDVKWMKQRGFIEDIPPDKKKTDKKGEEPKNDV